MVGLKSGEPVRMRFEIFSLKLDYGRIEMLACNNKTICVCMLKLDYGRIEIKEAV